MGFKIGSRFRVSDGITDDTMLLLAWLPEQGSAYLVDVNSGTPWDNTVFRVESFGRGAQVDSTDVLDSLSINDDQETWDVFHFTDSKWTQIL